MLKRIVAVGAVGILALAGAASAAVSITVVPAAALQGSFGMRVNFDGTGTNAYVQDDSPANESEYYATFRLRSDGMNQTDLSAYSMFRAYTTGGDQAFRVNVFRRGGGASTRFAIHVFPARDPGAGGGFYPREAVALREAVNGRPLGDQFTIAFKKGNGDGYIRVYRNGTLQKESLNLTNDTFTIDYVRWGALGAQTSNVQNGSFMDQDDFISTRTPQF